MRANEKDVVRNIRVSPLFEANKTYNLNTKQEDPNGTLRPAYNHCWVTWEKHVEHEDGNFWSKEAESFNTLSEANAYAEQLKKQLIKSKCCNADMVHGGVQCEACGSNGQ